MDGWKVETPEVFFGISFGCHMSIRSSTGSLHEEKHRNSHALFWNRCDQVPTLGFTSKDKPAAQAVIFIGEQLYFFSVFTPSSSEANTRLSVEFAEKQLWSTRGLVTFWHFVQLCMRPKPQDDLPQPGMLFHPRFFFVCYLLQAFVSHMSFFMRKLKFHSGCGKKPHN